MGDTEPWAILSRGELSRKGAVRERLLSTIELLTFVNDSLVIYGGVLLIKHLGPFLTLNSQPIVSRNAVGIEGKFVLTPATGCMTSMSSIMFNVIHWNLFYCTFQVSFGDLKVLEPERTIEHAHSLRFHSA